MIIDSILDRKGFEDDGIPVIWEVGDLRYMYDSAMFFGFDYLASAIDNGTEEHIRKALCRYIDEQGYNPLLKEYVMSKEWLPKEGA